MAHELVEIIRVEGEANTFPDWTAIQTAGIFSKGLGSRNAAVMNVSYHMSATC